MILLLNIVASTLIPLWLGYLLTSILTPRGFFRILPKLAISYGLGIGILSQLMLILSILEIPLKLNNIRLPLIFLIILLTIYYFMKAQKQNPLQEISTQSIKPSFLQQRLILLMFFYIGYNILFILWRTFYFPIQHWDAMATIGFKAKVMFFDQTIHRLNLPWGSYPLLVPFTESWTAINLGYWDDILVKTMFPIISICLLIVQYSFVKEITNKLWGMISLCLTLSSNFYIMHSSIGYRDIVISYYSCVSIILLLIWNKHAHAGLLVLASLFTGFVTFTKLEGTGYIFILYALFILILTCRKSLNLSAKLKYLTIYLIPSFLIFIAFHLYKNLIGVTNLDQRTQLLNPDQILFRFKTTCLVFFENLFLTGNWNLVWFLLLISIVLRWRVLRNQEETFLTGLTLLMFFGLYFSICTFTVSFNPIAGEASPTVLSRIILHFFPLAPILVALLNYKKPSDAQTPTP